MKSKKNSYFKYFSLFFAMIVLVLVAGCGPTPTAPIINSFLANPLTITVGESSNLSWSVTDATTVIIDNAIGSVALSGTTTVTPVTTTTYTLTATNSTGSVTASVTITVGLAYGSIDINSTPTGAKVYLDGVDTGSVTPYVITHIDVGIHTVKLDKYLYNIQEDTNVSVNAGETTYLNWSLTYASQQTITLQPGSEGKDAGVETFNPLSNYEDLNFFAAGNNPAPNVLRSYIQFDLSSVPNNAIITDADLKLYHYSSWGSDAFTIGLYKVTGSWLENTITWNNQPTSSSNAEFLRSIPAGSVNYWRYWDIDDLVQGWLDGSITNRGMLLMDTDEILVQTSALFYTSDYTTDTSKHPKLEIDYYIP
jgi:hypothetical protein